MANNQDHVWHILRDVLELLAGSGIPTPERGYALDGGWSLALSDLRRLVNDRNALRVQIKTVIAERDALRAELARLQAKLSAAEDAEDVKNGAINNLTAELAAAKDKFIVMKGYIDSFERTLEKAGVPKSNSEGDPFLWNERVGLLAEQSTALAADNARLRKALELAKSLRTAAWTGTAHVAAMVGHDIDDCECETCKGSRAELNHISDVMKEALASTPAQSLAAHEAALLREVADGVNKIAVVPTIDTPQSVRDLIADAIRAKADRIEKEAPHA